MERGFYLLLVFALLGVWKEQQYFALFSFPDFFIIKKYCEEGVERDESGY